MNALDVVQVTKYMFLLNEIIQPYSQIVLVFYVSVCFQSRFGRESNWEKHRVQKLLSTDYFIYPWFAWQPATCPYQHLDIFLCLIVSWDLLKKGVTFKSLRFCKACVCLWVTLVWQSNVLGDTSSLELQNTHLLLTIQHRRVTKLLLKSQEKWNHTLANVANVT